MRKELAKYLLGDDIFISYSRADGTSYAASLANALAKKNLYCRFDQWGTTPGTQIPATILKALRRSQMLAIVATERACESPAVEQEIQAFLPIGRFVVVIDLCGHVFSAKWWKLLEGLPVTADNKAKAMLEKEILADQTNQSTAAEPSPEVISRIENSIAFVRKDRRLRRASAMALVLLSLSISGAVVGTVIARSKTAEASRSVTAARNAEAAEAKANNLANEAEGRRSSAELQERHASGIAQAGDALTAQNPLRALRLTIGPLKIEEDHPKLLFSSQSRVIAAQSINQGVSRDYRYFSRVGSAALSPNGDYIAAVGSTASSLDDAQLDLWSVDGRRHKSLKGHWGPFAFSPDGKTLAVIKAEVTTQSGSQSLRVSVQWYSYDLQLIKQVALDPVPIAAKPEEVSPFIPDQIQNPLPFDLGGRSGRLTDSAGYVYDIQQIMFTPDGKRAVIAGSATINPRRLIPRSYRATIDLASLMVTPIIDMKNDLTLKTDDNREAVQVLGSSGSAVFASDKQLHLFEMASGKDEAIGQHSTEVRDFAASPSGERIVAVGINNEMSIFERINGAWRQRAIDLTGDRGCSRVIFVDEDYIAAAREDFTVTLAYVGSDSSHKKYLVDTSAGRLENPRFATLSGPTGQITSLVASADKKWLAAGGADRVAYVWNLRANDRRALQGNERGVTSISFSADMRRLATGGLDGTVRLWELNGPERRTVSAEPDRNDIQFYLSDNLSDRGEVLDSGWTRLSLREALGIVREIQLSRDGQYVLTQTYNDKVSLWNTDLNRLRTFECPTLTKAAISLDSKWVMVGRGQDETGFGKIIVRQGLDLYSISSSKTIAIDGDIEPDQDLFSPNGEWAEVRGDSLFLHKIAQGVDSKRLARGVFSADGEWFAMPGVKDVQIWDIRHSTSEGVRIPLSGNRLSNEDEDDEDVSPADIWTRFSPDGKHLAVSIREHGTSAIDLIVLPSKEHRTLRGRSIHGPYVFSPDGRWLAGTGGGVEVYLWAVKDGAPKVVGQHSELVNAIAFSPDSKWIASGSNDNTTRVWSVEGPEMYEIRQLAATQSVAFLHDGRTLLQGTGNGIQVWFSPSAPLEDLLRYLNVIADR